MKQDLNKTDRVLLLIQLICRAPLLTLSDKKVKEILGNPSKAQYHKIINELTNDREPRKAILLKIKDENDNIKFQLNQCDWVQYIEGTQEIQFILKTYKELGHLFPKIDSDGLPANSKHLDRRFYYLSQSRVKEELMGGHNHLEKLIKAIVGNRRLLIRYKGKSESDEKKAIEIFPLTIVQYKDDLYLVAYKSEMSDENLRNYKVSRILEILEKKETFKYPSINKWNPAEYFKNSSSIFIDTEKVARFRIYGVSRSILIEKNFFQSKIINQTSTYDEYECVYYSLEEFMGFLFVYGQDVEIVSDATLKKAFRQKAEKILSRN